MVWNTFGSRGGANIVALSVSLVLYKLFERRINMKLRRAWFLLTSLLLTVGLTGTVYEQASAVENRKTNIQGPSPKTQTPGVEKTITEEQAIAAIGGETE